MALIISKQDINSINALGEQSFPDECCGFLLGKIGDNGKKVYAMRSASNAREAGERYHRFLITPDAFMQTEKYARERGLDIIGFYHSHPDAPARPSGYDAQNAWPWYSYVIVSVRKAKAMELTSWVMADDRSQFNEEMIISE
jgi:proteasome lid subunit RPN8/RPN11